MASVTHMVRSGSFGLAVELVTLRYTTEFRGVNRNRGLGAPLVIFLADVGLLDRRERECAVRLAAGGIGPKIPAIWLLVERQCTFDSCS